MRYILKAESNDRRGAKRKLYCIIAGSAVALAAITAIADYAPDGELNVYADLEGEDFYHNIEIIGNNK